MSISYSPGHHLHFLEQSVFLPDLHLISHVLSVYHLPCSSQKYSIKLCCKREDVTPETPLLLLRLHVTVVHQPELLLRHLVFLPQRDSTAGAELADKGSI